MSKLERFYNFVIASAISIFFILCLIGLVFHQFLGYAVFFGMVCCCIVVFGGMIGFVFYSVFLMFKEAITGEKQDWPGGGPYYH